MADITVTPRNVSPLEPNGAVVRDYRLSGSADVGDVVYIVSDGTVRQADASVVGTATGRGIITGAQDSDTARVSGDLVPVCVLGPVEGFTGATPGDVGWVSNNAGALADAAGDVAHEMGYFESATRFFVYPDVSGAGS